MIAIHVVSNDWCLQVHHHDLREHCVKELFWKALFVLSRCRYFVTDSITACVYFLTFILSFDFMCFYMLLRPNDGPIDV